MNFKTNIMKRSKSADSLHEQRVRPKRQRRTSESLSNSIEKPYKEISHYTGKIKKFSTDYHVTEFILNHAISFPEEKLKNIFDELIDRAYRLSNSSGNQVS
jgi:hypothetical protein